jgi:hypothetical protein
VRRRRFYRKEALAKDVCIIVSDRAIGLPKGPAHAEPVHFASPLACIPQSAFLGVSVCDDVRQISETNPDELAHALEQGPDRVYVDIDVLSRVKIDNAVPAVLSVM